MKYFMFVWEPKTDTSGRHHNSDFIRAAIEKHVGKQSTFEAQSTLNASIINIGEKLTVLTCLIDNAIFFETPNHEITEIGIMAWLNSILGQTRSTFSSQWFVKEVLDPYPVS